MPPKSVLQPPSQLGITVEHYGKYRLQLSAMRELGMSAPIRGPSRATKAAADDDLAQARTCASRRDMLDFVLALSKTHLIAVQVDGVSQSGANSVPGMPFKSCSVHGTTGSDIAQPGSDIATSGGPHSAASCKLPSSVFVAASGKRNAADAIKQPRAQSMKRPRQMDPSSGDLHPAAESGANLAVEEAHSEKPAGLNTESSGVPQPAASCHEPRSPMVFMKILEPIWAAEVADGQKMFECVASKTKWQNQFKQLSSGDLFIVVLKGRDKVNAVCEVASPAIVKETNRDVLKSKLQEPRHAALDAYLDGAESFDYVEFKHVFDCRCFLSVSSTAAFLDHVGLALPKSPLVGLLRPVVLDEQWHSRLHEYMQQAVLRLPVSLATASHKAQIAASNVEGHVDKPAALAKMSRDVSEVASSGSAHSAASTEVLWLVLEESRYDAIASGRLRWEARPRDGTVREINNHLRDPYFDWKLARRGRSVVLQRGMGTGTYRKHAKTLAVKIAQVRIFSSAHQMLKSGEVVVAADLVPNCTDPIKFYEDLYGGAACANAFVAMRFEGPDEARPLHWQSK